MRGVPSLLDAIIPDVGKKCRHLVSKMLICPPPVSVAELFRIVIKKYTRSVFRNLTSVIIRVKNVPHKMFDQYNVYGFSPLEML